MTDAADMLERLGLTEYEQEALAGLLGLGPTTAPNLAEATGIPKARIYEVLDGLAERGFVKVVPGRPKEYHPRSPAEILDRAAENRRQAFEDFRRELAAMREGFLTTFQPQYEEASGGVRPAEELFYVVDVGEPSETETRRLYREAESSVHVLTKSLEYIDAIEPALSDAVDRVGVRVLLTHPELLSAENRAIQADIVAQLHDSYPSVRTRFATDRLPWRGTLVDPSTASDSGEAIFLVEEPSVPDHMRQAAITENGSFVAGLKRYMDLVWDHESVADYPQSDTE